LPTTSGAKSERTETRWRGSFSVFLAALFLFCGAAAGRAAIFIPFGAATDSHQLRNAQAMVAAGAGRVIPEPELTAERLCSEIFSLLDQPREIERMSTAARGLASPNAARDIVNLIEGVAVTRRASAAIASRGNP